MNDCLLPQPRPEFAPYHESLIQLGEERPEVVVLGADLGNSTEIDGFRQRFPQRFFNVGAAEQNEIGIATGLALEGEIPFVHSFGVFVTRRPYEQVCVQIALHQANVKLIGTIPGLTSRLGPTHQAIDDLALMRTLPHLTVIDPADATEIRQVVPAIAEHQGPVYLRMMRREVQALLDPQRYQFRIGQATLLREGSDIALLSCGLVLQQTLEAAALLQQQKIHATVLHVPTIKPLDISAIVHCATKTRALVTVENHLITGGLGSAVAEALCEHLPTPLLRLGLHDQFGTPGTPEYLFSQFGLTAQQIAESAQTLLER